MNIKCPRLESGSAPDAQPCTRLCLYPEQLASAGDGLTIQCAIVGILFRVMKSLQVHNASHYVPVVSTLLKMNDDRENETNGARKAENPRDSVVLHRVLDVKTATLVFPYFDYAEILLTDLSSDNKTKLQRTHNLCTDDCEKDGTYTPYTVCACRACALLWAQASRLSAAPAATFPHPIQLSAGPAPQWTPVSQRHTGGSSPLGSDSDGCPMSRGRRRSPPLHLSLPTIHDKSLQPLTDEEKGQSNKDNWTDGNGLEPNNDFYRGIVFDVGILNCDNKVLDLKFMSHDVNMLGENPQTIRENKLKERYLNHEKTKYMIMSRKNIVRNGTIKIGDLSRGEKIQIS
ncbi:hypothetical protein ANN_23622 [Periplaneta americana]|uniref:Uncharacterized protein n=1 Tax=Periplaneta americana TaxID=6978 RepID=A0ABQ8SM22_PERAM|nr:hypothetical protein ANN_23622 [Periplaneta americana]